MTFEERASTQYRDEKFGTIHTLDPKSSVIPVDTPFQAAGYTNKIITVHHGGVLFGFPQRLDPSDNPFWFLSEEDGWALVDILMKALCEARDMASGERP